MVDNQQIKIIDEVFMKDLREALKDTLFYDDWQIAYQFVRKFEPPLLANSAQISAQVKSELKDWIIRCKWSALPVLKDDEVVDLFKNHFEAQYNLPGAYYDLWDKLRAKLINIPFYTDRDNLRSRVKKTLLGSEGVVTSHGPFDLSGKEIRPTVKNWLIDY